MGESLSILVADDDPVSRMVVAGMLRRSGHDVDTAIDGLEAVEAATRRTYDVIFMDLQMPELDGLEAARRIRTATDHSRIVALTATVDDETRERCRLHGIEEILGKPVDAARVERLASSVVSTKTERDPEAEEEISADALDRFRREVASHILRPVDEVIADIVAGMRAQLAELCVAVERRDRAGVAASAHSLRGSSATIGATRLAGRMATLEAAALDLDDETLDADAAAARDEIGRIEARLASG